MLDPNLVVTGRYEGKSIFLEERPLPSVTTSVLPGLELFLAWGTADGPISNSADKPTAVLAPYFPGPGGTRLLLVTWAAVSHAQGDSGAEDSSSANSTETEDILAGLIASVEVDDPGMHTSATLDYGIVIAGEMWLELDDGEQRRLPTGSCVVQRGTRHRWSNRSATDPATMAFVLIGANDAGQEDHQ